MLASRHAAGATIPVFVSGGLALYLFGVIGMQGIALMQEHKVNSSSRCRSTSAPSSW